MMGLRDAPGLYDLRTVMCRLAVHPRTKPLQGELGESSGVDDPAGAPVLQQGGPELMSTAWQRDVASGEVGQRRLPPVSGVESASGPEPRDVCTHRRGGPDGGRVTGPCGRHIWRPPCRLLRFGLQAGWPYRPALAAVAVDSAPGPPGSGLRRLNRATGRVVKKIIYIYTCLC